MGVLSCSDCDILCTLDWQRGAVRLGWEGTAERPSAVRPPAPASDAAARRCVRGRRALAPGAPPETSFTAAEACRASRPCLLRILPSF